MCHHGSIRNAYANQFVLKTKNKKNLRDREGE